MKEYKIDYSEDLPLMDYGIIRIVGKQPFYDWMNSFDDGFIMSIEDDFDRGICLMTDGDWVDENVTRFMKVNYEKIFENFLHGWHTDDESWPKDRGWKVFCEWFEWQYSSMIFNTPLA